MCTSIIDCMYIYIYFLLLLLKDKEDYLDATMITREIKSRNPKP